MLHWAHHLSDEEWLSSSSLRLVIAEAPSPRLSDDRLAGPDAGVASGTGGHFHQLIPCPVIRRETRTVDRQLSSSS